MLRSFARGFVVAAAAVFGTALTGCKFGDNGGGAYDAGGFDGFAPQNALLTASPAAQDFGTVNLGAKSASKAVLVANVGGQTTGSIAVTLTGGDAFSIDADGCTGMALASAGACTVSVHFAPQAAGPQSATLRVSANPGGDTTVTLSGTGAGTGLLAMTPAMKDLGSVPPSGTSAPVTFSVTNKGNVPSGVVTIAITGSDAQQFVVSSDVCSGTMLAPKAACSVAVAASPTTPGPKAASITATAAGDPGTATASLSATGLAGAGFVVKPTAYDFGSLVQGTAAPPDAGPTFTVENAGGVTSGVPMLAVTGPNAQDFSLSDASTCTDALAPMGTCTFGVSFAPSTPMAESATVTATAPMTVTGQASLIGTGLAPAALTITPTSQPFPSIVQGGTPSSDMPFQVQNTGGVTTGTLAVSLVGTSSDQFGLGMDGCTGQVLAPGKTCPVKAHFAPTVTGMAGGLQASLQVSGTPGGQTASTLTGTALTPAALTVTPTTQPLGSVVQGRTGMEYPLQVTNKGQGTSGPLSVTLSGTMKADFALGTDGCTGQTLNPGGMCTVNAYFAPGSSSHGGEGATLTVSAAPGGSAPVTLTATALAPAQLSIGQPLLPEWTNAAVGSNAGNVSFTVSNVGDMASGTITYGIAAPFAYPRQPPNPCTGSLSPGASCTFQATFVPQTAGLTTGSLTASANPGGSAQATLEGTAQWVLEVSVFSESGCQAASGSVTSSPGGINCAVPATLGSTNLCTAQFADKTGVALTFSGNSPGTPSGCTPTPNVFPPQCTLAMTANQFVTVNYCGLIP